MSSKGVAAFPVLQILIRPAAGIETRVSEEFDRKAREGLTRLSPLSELPDHDELVVATAGEEEAAVGPSDDINAGWRARRANQLHF